MAITSARALVGGFSRSLSSFPIAIPRWISSASEPYPASKKKNVRVYISESHDPFFNLATEDWLFRNADLEEETLFLWRNKPTIVIGRNQNPWKEIHIGKMEEAGVVLSRRQSGGGAVYQDLGNTNFTFVSHRDEFSKERNNAILVAALASFNVPVVASGRNDIVMSGDDGRKISGSAFKFTKDRAFHHGTLLIDVQLNALGALLNPSKAKLLSKGITSVAARVVNLTEINSAITHESLSAAIMREFYQCYSEEESEAGWLGRHGRIQPAAEPLSATFLNKQPSLLREYEHYTDWNWRYGETPGFTNELEHRFDWGSITIHLDSPGAVQIEKCRIFSDCLIPELVEISEKALSGIEYSIPSVVGALRKAEEGTSSEDIKGMLVDLQQWIPSAL